VDCRLLGSWPETGFEEITDDLLQADFWAVNRAVLCLLAPLTLPIS
jgi:hypothetical protein